MITERKTADAAIGGRTARACDCCSIKRARWFCAADDAFLCQGCDTSVHSANQLASRHERVRLQTSSLKAMNNSNADDGNFVPAWHKGFTRKARTPRHGKSITSIAKQEKYQEEALMANNPFLALVPEIGSEGTSPEDNQEQLLYRVPIFDPFDAELCSPNTPNDINNMQTDGGHEENTIGVELNALLNDDDDHETDLNIPEFLGSDIELAEFAADVETLLSTGLEDVYNGEEQKGLDEVCLENARVKVEDEDEEVKAVIACHLDPAIDMAREGMSWELDDYYTSRHHHHMNGAEVEDEEEEKMKVSVETSMVMMNDASKVEEVERRKLLRLNYEAVITAWDSHGGCPWTNGIRPDFNPNAARLDLLGENHHHGYGRKENGIRAHGGGREARVSRYREKRRTRLFSKKIRYEVRKLNAEQRPRIKGRFVKRTAMAGSTFPYL